MQEPEKKRIVDDVVQKLHGGDAKNVEQSQQLPPWLQCVCWFCDPFMKVSAISRSPTAHPTR